MEKSTLHWHLQPERRPFTPEAEHAIEQLVWLLWKTVRNQVMKKRQQSQSKGDDK